MDQKQSFIQLEKNMDCTAAKSEVLQNEIGELRQLLETLCRQRGIPVKGPNPTGQAKVDQPAAGWAEPSGTQPLPAAAGQQTLKVVPVSGVVRLEGTGVLGSHESDPLQTEMEIKGVGEEEDFSDIETESELGEEVAEDITEYEEFNSKLEEDALTNKIRVFGAA